MTTEDTITARTHIQSERERQTERKREREREREKERERERETDRERQTEEHDYHQTCRESGAYEICKGSQETLSFSATYLSEVSPISSAWIGGLYNSCK